VTDIFKTAILILVFMGISSWSTPGDIVRGFGFFPWIGWPNGHVIKQEIT